MPRFRSSLGHRSQQVGLLVATANLPTAYQRTLMPRSTVDQALVTGMSFGANQALATLLHESLQALALVVAGQAATGRPDARRWSRSTMAVDVVAFGAGLVVQRALRMRDREPLGRAAGRAAGFWVTAAGGAGVAIGGLQEGLGRREGGVTIPAVVPAAAALTTAAAWRNRTGAGGRPATADGSTAQVLRALAMGLGVTGASVGFSALEGRVARRIAGSLARVLPGNPAVWRPVGHAVTATALVAGARLAVQRVFESIESHEVSVEAAFDVPPLRPELSGSLASEVPYDTMAKQGRRFVWSATHPSTIEQVMGEPGRYPVRVYVGLESAPTDKERVALAMADLERAGAFDRAWLMVASPTGTGYVNYEAVSSLELLTRGNCATVAMQYAARPSVLSLDRVRAGHRHARLLLEAIHARLAGLPERSRPRLLLFGESLGAWTSQDAVLARGTDGLVELGVDHAIWIGTPHFSKWKEQVLHDPRPDVDRALLGVYDRIEDWRAQPAERRASVRYVMITHEYDGVALFGPELVFQAPPWLDRSVPRPRRVPEGMRWFPNTTFFQVFVDMKNSAKVIPGRLEAKGHDYRGDLLPFFHETLGLEATTEQLRAAAERLATDEVARSEWTGTHAGAGSSMAAAVVRQWMEEHPDDVEQVLGQRLRGIAGQAGRQPTRP